MKPDLTLVTSRTNQRLKLVRSLGGSSGIRKHGVFLMEGPRFISDYIGSTGLQPVFAVMCAECTGPALETAEIITGAGTEILCVPVRLFSDLTDTGHSQGILAVCSLPPAGLDTFIPGRNLLILDRVSDPGNVGTAIRSAAAFAAGGVVCGKGTCFPFLPKVTRAAAGCNATVPLAYGADPAESAGRLKDAGFLIAGADPGGMPVTDFRPSGNPVALVVGSEAHGLSDSLTGLLDARLAIPMHGTTESLNAGVSASILLYLLGTPRPS